MLVRRVRMFVMQTSLPAAPRPLRIKLGLRTWRDDLAAIGANRVVAQAISPAVLESDLSLALAEHAAHKVRRRGLTPFERAVRRLTCLCGCQRGAVGERCPQCHLTIAEWSRHSGVRA